MSNSTASSGLTPSQTYAISTTERTASVFSLLGAFVIIITFLSDKGFRKPINRLVFYAAWGNIFTNVATIISVNGIGIPGVCQFQAFLIQWFMPADALWAFAMACNVYLTFFHKYGAAQLRMLEWKYFLFCYGASFIPAFCYFFIHTSARGYVYGSAVLWCWVSLEWDFLRIAVFYGPVWVIILLTFIIYLMCGRIIFQWRSQLLSLAAPARTQGSATPEPNLDGRYSKNEHRIGQAQTTDQRVPNYQERYTATVSAGNHSKKVSGGGHTPWNRKPVNDSDRVTVGANRAAINYCRVAILFFVALCITWIPSTINRVWTLVHPTDPLFSLNYASGLVLPLQGFWNGVIYVTTSWPAFVALIKRLSGRDAKRAHAPPETFGPTNLNSSTIRGGDSKQSSVLMQAVENIKYQRSNSVAHTATESETGLRDHDEEDHDSRESAGSGRSESRMGKW